jgi:hypothetical protein
MDRPRGVTNWLVQAAGILSDELAHDGRRLFGVVERVIAIIY